MANGAPLMPKHPTNPAGQVQRIRESTAPVKEDYRDIERWLVEELLKMPTLEVSALQVNRIEWRLPLAKLRELFAELRRRLGRISAKPVIKAVKQAYSEGTAKTWANLEALLVGTGIAISLPDLDVRESSRAWLRNVSLLQSTAGSAMRKIAQDTYSDVTAMIEQAFRYGTRPSDVIASIRKRFKSSRNRVERDARSNITDAVREAGWDESEIAERELGLRTKLMHLSAFSPTTRPHHAARHGNLYTRTEIRDWYAVGGNRFNCKCNQVPVLVDKKGNPYNSDIVKQAKETRRRKMAEAEDA